VCWRDQGLTTTLIHEKVKACVVKYIRTTSLAGLNFFTDRSLPAPAQTPEEGEEVAYYPDLL
jgi:hypothetical protein